MSTKLALARALVRNTDLPVAERRQQLVQITAEVRRDHDQKIAAIRNEIAALRRTTAGSIWKTVVAVITRVPEGRKVAEIAKLRVQLAEAHAAKFAALAELKVLKTFT